MKRKIKIIIERSKDSYWAYAEKIEKISGIGDTPQEAKQSIMDCIKILTELGELPTSFKGNIELVYQFDSQSLLNYYKGIFSNAALERISGINQKQLQHYASGLKKPRYTQAKKLETALHKLGGELLAVEL